MFIKKLFSSKKVSKGFTLVEIIVVLVILAILAAATIPSMLGFIDEAKFKTIDNEARVVRSAAQAYATEQSAKGETDDKITNDINGVINSNHALHNLLQNDANGTVFETKVEKGKIRKFNYTKEIINGDEDYINDKVRYAIFDDSKSSLLHATGTVASINNIESFKAELMESLTASLTSSLTASLNSNLESSVSSLETSLTTNLNSSLESGMNSKIATLKTNFATELGSNVVDLVYPVGSFYVSYNSTSPATLFPGTNWEQITNRFLYCANSSGQTGGEAEHILTVNEMPSHKHNVVGSSSTDGRYLHQVGSGANNGQGNHNGIPNIRGTEAYTAITYCIDNTGGGAAHNNMPPYLTVYCWRRIANN